MTNFDNLWSEIVKRCDDLSFPLVQDRKELEHVYDLMVASECNSYLEIGSAEGNSLYVLGNATDNFVDCIDIGEVHTDPKRAEMMEKLRALGKTVTEYIGDSTNQATLPNKQKYDCVLIDGGHDYHTVLSDAMMYAPLATRYVFFHDVQLQPVADAIRYYLDHWKIGKYRTFINSDSFGYGVIEVGCE